MLHATCTLHLPLGHQEKGLYAMPVAMAGFEKAQQSSHLCIHVHVTPVVLL